MSEYDTLLEPKAAKYLLFVVFHCNEWKQEDEISVCHIHPCIQDCGIVFRKLWFLLFYIPWQTNI